MKESHGREQRIIRKRNSEQEAIQRVRDNFKGSQWDLERTTLKLVDGINLVDRIPRDTKLNKNKKGDIYEKRRIKYFKWLPLFFKAMVAIKHKPLSNMSPMCEVLTHGPCPNGTELYGIFVWAKQLNVQRDDMRNACLHVIRMTVRQGIASNFPTQFIAMQGWMVSVVVNVYETMKGKSRLRTFIGSPGASVVAFPSLG